MISPAGGSGPNPLEGYPREIHSCATLNAVSRPRRRIRHVELLRNRCFTAAGNQVRTPLPLMWLCSARMVGEGPSRNPSCVCPNLAWSARMVAGPGFDPAQEAGWLSTLPVGRVRGNPAGPWSWRCPTSRRRRRCGHSRRGSRNSSPPRAHPSWAPPPRLWSRGADVTYRFVQWSFRFFSSRFSGGSHCQQT